MITRRLVVGTVLAALATLPAATAASARQQSDTAGLGGGSDIRSGSVISVPAGTSVPAVHQVTADNPGGSPIEVQFRADAPKGITIEPARDRARIEPGTSVRVPFSIHVDAHAPIGEHRVTVQLVRADVRPVEGAVTNVPAVGTSFVVRTSGETGTVIVRAVGAETDQPVDGTLALSAISEGTKPFEVARESGSEMTARVAAPGRYRASYWLDGTELAHQDVTVRSHASVTVTLSVRSVSFLFARAEPERQDDSIVTAELTGTVQNHLGDVAGPASMIVQVEHDGERIDVVTIDDFTKVPTGLTEASRTYRPRGGFEPGRYRFHFELRTPDFTVRYSEPASFVVPTPSTLARFVPWAIGAVVAIGLAIWAWRRRRTAARQTAPVPAPIPPRVEHMPLQQPSATPEPQPEIRFDTVPLVATVTVTATAPAPVTEPAFGTQPAPAPGPAAEGDPLPGVMRTGQNWPWKLDGGTWSAEWTEADTPDRSGSAPDA